MVTSLFFMYLSCCVLVVAVDPVRRVVNCNEPEAAHFRVWVTVLARCGQVAHITKNLQELYATCPRLVNAVIHDPKWIAGSRWVRFSTLSIGLSFSSILSFIQMLHLVPELYLFLCHNTYIYMGLHNDTACLEHIAHLRQLLRLHCFCVWLSWLQKFPLF